VAVEGWPSRAQLVETYFACRGRELVDDLAYYEILYNFRLAVLLEGIYQRSLRDPARGAQHPVGERALLNVDRAVELVHSHR
jgi:aminoglycoside phosphotransferase (APT) family kinase protein